MSGDDERHDEWPEATMNPNDCLDAGSLLKQLAVGKKRIADLEAAMRGSASILDGLSMATDGHMRGRVCSVSNRLNHALGRSISSHGDQPCKACGRFDCASNSEIEAALDVADAARDLVLLWEHQKIAGLPRAERNAVIEGVRATLIDAVRVWDEARENFLNNSK